MLFSDAAVRRRSTLPRRCPRPVLHSDSREAECNQRRSTAPWTELPLLSITSVRCVFSSPPLLPANPLLLPFRSVSLSLIDLFVSIPHRLLGLAGDLFSPCLKASISAPQDQGRSLFHEFVAYPRKQLPPWEEIGCGVTAIEACEWESFCLSVKMAFTIRKAMRWWEKGVQPNMREIQSAQDLVDSLASVGDKLVALDFFSPGCGGCKALHPKDIRVLFPPDCNPFYAGFGNRDTDEISYRKVGIPRGKIFIINPKGEVAVNRRVDTKSYTSLHALVSGMFPPMSSAEQEDYNSWNYWKLPLPDVRM